MKSQNTEVNNRQKDLSLEEVMIKLRQLRRYRNMEYDQFSTLYKGGYHE